jgi:hypothetical protein
MVPDSALGLPHLLGACLATLALACAETPPPGVPAPASTETPRGAAASTPPPPTLNPESQRLLAALDENSPKLTADAVTLARRGDAERRAVVARLLQMARAIMAPDQAAAREELREANRQAGYAATPKQLDAQLDWYQTDKLLPVFEAMKEIGGAEITAFCFGVAEDKAAPRDRRRAALAVLEGTVDASDAAAVKRRTSVGDLKGADPAASAAADAAMVVGALRPRFKVCWKRHIEASPVEGRVVIVLEPTGRVSEATADGGIRNALATCLVEVAKTARFSAPKGGTAKIVVPLKFAP